MREDATPWSSAAVAAEAGITAAACVLRIGIGGGACAVSLVAGYKATREWWIGVRLHVCDFFKVTWGWMDCDDRARVGCGTYPEERLLEERAALGDGGVFGKSRLDLHLMPGAELARGGDHRVAQLSLGVGACGAEHGGDAGRGAGARDDTGRRAGGAEVRGGHGGGHFDLT
mgnify:CR=1 FL=1|jgi:hypothetical protein